MDPFPPPSIQPGCTAVQSVVSWNRLSICQIPQRIASSCLRRVESHYQTKGITSLQIGGTRWLHMWLCIPGAPATPALCKPPLILTLTLHNGNLCGIQKGRGRQTKEIILLIWRWLVIRVVLLTVRKLCHPLEQYKWGCFCFVGGSWWWNRWTACRDSHWAACSGTPVPTGFRRNWQWGAAAPPI